MDANSLGGPRALILMSLIDGPKHGYAIIDDIHDATGLRLGPGTLYGAITALEEGGLIAALPPQGRRRPYELTSDGHAAAATQEEAWQRLVTVAAAKRSAVARVGRAARTPRPAGGAA